MRQSLPDPKVEEVSLRSTPDRFWRGSNAPKHASVAGSAGSVDGIADGGKSVRGSKFWSVPKLGQIQYLQWTFPKAADWNAVRNSASNVRSADLVPFLLNFAVSPAPTHSSF